MQGTFQFITTIENISSCPTIYPIYNQNSLRLQNRFEVITTKDITFIRYNP